MEPLAAPEIRSYADRLLVARGEGSSAAGLIDLIAALEDLKSAACAVQAEISVAFDARRRSEQAAAGVPARRQGRGIAAEIALARRESPHRGQVLLGLAKMLVGEMPHTLARLRDGSLNEFRTTLLARETGCLTAEQRLLVDERVCADPGALDGIGTRRLLSRVRRMAVELDPAAVARRARQAEADRNVTVRPAPDTMAYVTGLMPVAQAVAVYAALRRDADALRAAGDPRSRGQLMSDLLLARATGVVDSGSPEQSPAVPVTINLTMSEETLAGGHGAAGLTADGVAAEVLPSEVARLLTARAFAARTTVWFRRLYANTSGRLIAMTSKQRLFPDGIADFLALQGHGICASPYCDAPIRHADHIVPVDQGGETGAANGQGLCESCNHAKQAPGWQQDVVSPEHERPQVQTITPTGHRYTATAPAPPGHYGLIA